MSGGAHREIKAAVDVSIVVVVPTRLRRPEVDYVATYNAVAATGRSIEFVFVLDGPNTSAAASLMVLAKSFDVTVLSFAETFGRAACLNEAVRQPGRRQRR